jgi:cytochrome P450
VDCPEYDFAPASATAHPYAGLRAMRERCPVVHSDRYGGHWTLLGYEQVHRVAIDPGTFKSGDGVPFPSNPFPPVPRIEVDPPLHKQFRAPLLDRFSPRAVARHEPYNREMIGGLIDALITKPEFEVVDELLQPMTGYVAAQFLGFPEADRPKLSHWAARVLANGDDIGEVMLGMLGYFGEVYAARKAEPTDDVPTLLTTMHIDGEPMSQTYFVLTMSTIFVGGLDTTVSAGSHILEWLAEHPAERRLLRDEPDRIPVAVEEFLRYFSPLMSLRRVAVRDTEIDGHPIKAGETVLLHWLAANHDPAEFDRPDEVVLDRKRNRHFAFGSGPHRCIGSNVARQSLRLLLEELLARIGDWSLVPGRPAKRYPAVVRGVEELWLRPVSEKSRYSTTNHSRGRRP